MRFVSPLRYPGGKAPIGDALREILDLNGLRGRAVAEPFAGGAGAALSLLISGDAPRIHINDLDRAIYEFWVSAIHDSEAFLVLLDASPVSVGEWRRWRDVYRDEGATPLDRGFAAFYLNRCNRSGIIKNGSVIGGLDQGGRWKIGARFNKPALRERLERIAKERDRISVTNLDGLEFIKTVDARSTLFFIDPPYVGKGHSLYLNGLDMERHARLASHLRRRRRAAWVLTYDDHADIRALYEDWAMLHTFSLRYTASQRRQESEILITPRWLRLPERITFVR